MDSVLHASWEGKLKWVRHCAVNQLDLGEYLILTVESLLKVLKLVVSDPFKKDAKFIRRFLKARR